MAKTLIITAGGVKGFLALGGLLALRATDTLRDYTNFCGVSVGSILATFLAMNLTYLEIFTESMEFDFFDSLTHIFRNFDTLAWISRQRKKNIKGIGLLDPTKIQERIEYWMIVRYRKKLTFLDLYNYTGNTLTVVVTDRTDPENPEPLYLNWKTAPSYSIARAVVESCSIPGVFELENPSRIDGVFSDPLPYEIAEGPSVAFVLQEDLKIPDDAGLTEALLHIYSATLIPIKLMLREKMKKCPANIKIIQLKRVTNGIEMPVPFNMSLDDKIKMVLTGYQQTMEQLTGQ